MKSEAEARKELETLEKVVNFLRKMQALKDELWRPEGQRSRAVREISDEMYSLLNEIEEFDKALGPGLRLGRLASWPDEHYQEAPYFVIGIGRREVKMVWLPAPEAGHSPAVAGGRALRLAVERALFVKDWHRTHDGVLVMDDD